jgi:hypothetical protein
MRAGATLTGRRFICNAYAATEAGRACRVVGCGTIALPGNVDLILILILALINWVEGRFKFTYVEST